MSYSITRWVSRRRSALISLSAACVAAALLSLPLAASSAASEAASSPIPAQAVQRLTSVIGQMAKMSGDAKPAWVEAAMTTRGKALQVATPGDRIPGSGGQVLYLVAMKGNFTLNEVPTPPKAHAPAGHYLTLTLNPATFQIVDLGLTDRSPAAALRSLGPVSTLRLLQP
jgi:hypothetical protein